MRNNYVFTKDDHSITLYKKSIIKDEKSKNYGKEIDVLIGHYSNVEQVMKKLVQLELIDSGSIKDLLVDLKVVNQNVSALIKECLK